MEEEIEQWRIESMRYILVILVVFGIFFAVSCGGDDDDDSKGDSYNVGGDNNTLGDSCAEVCLEKGCTSDSDCGTEEFCAQGANFNCCVKLVNGGVS